MAENQEIVRLRGELDIAKGKIEDLRAGAARTEVIAERVTNEIVPGMKELTDAVAQLHSRLGALAVKLGLIGAGIATVAALVAQYLFRMVTE